MIGASGPAGCAALGAEPVATAAAGPPAATPARVAPVPTVTGIAPTAPPAAAPDPAAPAEDVTPPLCAGAEIALCCCCATPVRSGLPFAAATMSSWLRRLPPQALTAMAGSTASVHHHREPLCPAIWCCLRFPSEVGIDDPGLPQEERPRSDPAPGF